MNICVFCSSASDLAECYVNAAKELGEAIGKRGHALVFGGYDMGLMGEAAKAALAAGEKLSASPPKGSHGKIGQSFPAFPY